MKHWQDAHLLWEKKGEPAVPLCKQTATERQRLPAALRACQQGTLFVWFCDYLFNHK